MGYGQIVFCSFLSGQVCQCGGIFVSVSADGDCDYDLHANHQEVVMYTIKVRLYLYRDEKVLLCYY